jgi:hypothetical protein
MSTRQKTAAQVGEAGAAWATAPIHVRAMAGAYVAPLLAAIQRIDEELAEHHAMLEMSPDFFEQIGGENE